MVRDIKQLWLAAAISLLVMSAPLNAQCRWSLLSSYGYGGAGLGAAFLTSSPSWPSLGSAALFTGGGLVGGYMLGSRACRAAERSEPLSGAHRFAVRLGTVFAGGTTGAIVAGIITEGPGEPGSDEAILATSIGVGLAAGVLVQYLLERSRPLNSTMRLGMDGNGASISAVFAF